MCQLLGLNCALPTDCTFSFSGFVCRGGRTNIHADGWGLAFYEGRRIRTFLDTNPAAHSPIAQFLNHYPIKTFNMLAHIRYGTTGVVKLDNVHPFEREMWGIQWCFAHNGDVPQFTGYGDELPWIGKSKPGDRVFNPVGDTDSEAVFCALLNVLRSRFDKLPTLPILYDTLLELCNEICTSSTPPTHSHSHSQQRHSQQRHSHSYSHTATTTCDSDTNATCGGRSEIPTSNGTGQSESDADTDTDTGGGVIFNFLLMCGEHLQFAYSWPGRRKGSKCWNGLHYVVRQHPFRTAKLIDRDYEIDFATVTSPDDRVAVIATEPLTNDEDWIEFKRGELILFDDGRALHGNMELDAVESKGHGLKSKFFPTMKKEKRYKFRLCK